MTLHELFHRLMGSHEEPFSEINSYDMSRPVHRPGDRPKYEMPIVGQTLIEQMKRVRRAEVIK